MSRSPRGKQSTYFVPALEKGLDILETLAATAKPQTLADLSRTLDRTSSEIFRMVDTLERRNYIVRDAQSGGYRLSMKLYELSHTHSPVEHLVRAAAPPMRELSSTVRESCHLAILSGSHLVVVAEELSAERVRLSVEVGSRAPALRTVSGKLILAHFAPEDLEMFLQNDDEFNTLAKAGKEALRAELAGIRKRGSVIAPSAYRTGIDVAVIVGNPAVGVVASLAVPILAGGVNEGREELLLETMWECAARITAALRLTPAHTEKDKGDR